MYDKAISSYKNAPTGTREDIKKKYQNNKLNLQGSIQNAIAAPPGQTPFQAKYQSLFIMAVLLTSL
jgi:hypothetical protein